MIGHKFLLAFVIPLFFGFTGCSSGGDDPGTPPPVINAAPVSVNDAFTTNANTLLIETLTAADADNDPLTFSIVGNGTLGTVVITNPATGAFTYTPNPGVIGVDTITFTANDGTADSNLATVSISILFINVPPVAPNDAFTTDANTPLIETLTATDADNDPLTFSIVGNGTLGTAVITNPATGAFIYTSNMNASGADSFTFMANDGTLNSNVATISVMINPVNVVPVASDVVLFTDEDIAANAILPATDANNDPLTFSIVNNGTLGTAVISNPVTGAYTYTPNLGATGVDTFTFMANDGMSNSNVATVTIAINLVTTILFPTPTSQTDASTVTVRGVLTNTAGVVNVWVNGVSATSLDGFATWERTVPLSLGLNSLVVDVETFGGGVLTGVATAQILRESTLLDFPQSIALDVTNGRAFVVDQTTDLVLAVNLTSGVRTVFSGATVGAGQAFIDLKAVILDAANNRLIVLDASNLVAVNLVSGDRSLLSSGAPGQFATSLILDTAGGRVLMTDDVLDAVIEVSLATGNRTIISDAATGTGVLFQFPAGITLDAANGRVLVTDKGFDAIVAVNLVSGNRTIFSDAVTGAGVLIGFPDAITLDVTNGRALVIDNQNRILTVDLVSGDRSIVSDFSVGSGPMFGFASDIALDAASGRAFVPDQRLRAIISVDLASGDRSILTSDLGNGSGIFMFPSRVVLDSASGRLLVSDSGNRTVDAISLTTGDRTVISSSAVGTGPDLNFVFGIALDSVNGRVFLVDHNLQALFAVDLASGDRTILSDATTGTGPLICCTTGGVTNFPGMVLDMVNGRVFLTDTEADSILVVDLASGDRIVLSDGVTGLGPAFQSPNGLVLDAINGRLLVADFNNVTAVDLGSGDRSTISSAGVGSGPAFINAAGITLDSGNGRVLVSDAIQSLLVSVDLTTGDRIILADLTTGIGPHFVRPVSMVLDTLNGNTYVVDSNLNGIFSMETRLSSGDRVILSR